jgi:hypothetical protein
MEYLIQLESHLASSSWFSILGYSQSSDLVWFQSKLLHIFLYFLFAFLGGHIIPCVYDEFVLSLYLGSRLLRIGDENLVEVDMETHELGERLLAEEPLRLQIHLRNGLAWQALSPKKWSQ